MHNQRQNHPVERRAVLIDDVDMNMRVAHAQDKTGGRIMVGFRYAQGAMQIPNPGETWIVERNTSHEWHLFRRRDKQAEHADLQDMAPGDTRLRAPGSLHIRAQAISVASDPPVSGPKPLGATRWQKRTTVGATTSWTLAEAPIDLQTVMFFDNGSLVDPSTLSLTSGNVLHFSSIATSHTLIVYYQVV